METEAATAQRRSPAELRKPHEMVVMVTKKGRMTVTGRKIYTVMLAISQDRLESLNAMPPADYLFSAPLNAMLRSSGSSVNDRTDAKRYLREMRDFAVDWESTAPGNGIKWEGFSLVSQVVIELKNGENWVGWSFPPAIMSALRGPARWARINVDMIARLSSYAAISIYEVASRYRDNPSGLSSRQSTAWWSDATSHEAAEGGRREWRKVKYERIKPAIEEINAETDLEVELIEHKHGRSVIEVQLAIRKKKTAPVIRIAEDPPDARLIVRGESLGIRELRMEALIKEFGADLVRAKVTVLESRIGNRDLKIVENALSYLRSLLRNHQQGDLTIEEAGCTTSVEGAGDERSAIKPPGHSTPQPQLEEQWVQERWNEVRQRIDALPPGLKKTMIDEAVTHLKTKGLLTAVVMRRAEQGDITHGMLGATVVELFAVREYGADWKKMPVQEGLGRKC